MLVVLGAWGSGKSSFFRAGLWPRLKRDDRIWLSLPTIRPERAVISGKFGLVQALQQVMSDTQFADGIRKRGLPRSRAEIQDFIDKTEDGSLRFSPRYARSHKCPGSPAKRRRAAAYSGAAKAHALPASRPRAAIRGQGGCWPPVPRHLARKPLPTASTAVAPALVGAGRQLAATRCSIML